MAVRLLCFCLLLNLLCFSWAKKHLCLKHALDCDMCIQSGPDCAWCTDFNSTRRCGTVKELQKSGCSENFMYNPQGSVQALTNVSSTEPSDAKTPLIQPQELSIRLRPGVSQSFNLTIVPTVQPIWVFNLGLVSTYLPAGADLTMGVVTSGNPSILQIRATRCPIKGEYSDEAQNRTGPWFINFTSRGLSVTVKLDITLECQCECMSQPEVNSPVCSERGTLVCGECKCQRPYFGRQCERNEDTWFTSDDACRSGPNAPLCSGRGTCVEGSCDCHQRVNPDEKYSGQFCQCSNFECPYDMGRLCGDNGKCECGKCVCLENWTGEACSCSLETANCMAQNQMLCNGQGNCECGSCVCNPPYAGPKCEFCPTCLNTCQLHAACAECRAFGTGVKADRCEALCDYLVLTKVETKNDLPEPLCKIRQHNDCIFYFNYCNKPSGQHITVAGVKECPAPDRSTSVMEN